VPLIPALPHRTTAELTAQLDYLRSAPADTGSVHLVVRRPERFEREILSVGQLDRDAGMVGDNWLSRATSHALASGRHLDAQVDVMSARMVRLLSDDVNEQAYAGDQLFLDLDLGVANLPAGAQLAIGSAVIEITPHLHTGCVKFSARFGPDALRFVNSTVGRELRLRGACARVVVPGTIRQGDSVRKTQNSTQ
jgi:hypothetical protein